MNSIYAVDQDCRGLGAAAKRRQITTEGARRCGSDGYRMVRSTLQNKNCL